MAAISVYDGNSMLASRPLLLPASHLQIQLQRLVWVRSHGVNATTSAEGHWAGFF
jgi:hypothetical protein